MQNLISQDYLMHHGVKGMKWGVRKDKGSSGGNPLSISNFKKRRKANNEYRTTMIPAKAKQKELFKQSYTRNGNPFSRKNMKLRRDANKEFRATEASARQKLYKEFKESYKMSPQTKQKVRTAAILGGTIAAGALATYGSVKITDSMFKQQSIAQQQRLNTMRNQMNNIKYVGYTYKRI